MLTSTWLLTLVVVVLALLALLVWAARNVGGSTRMGQTFMTSLEAMPCRYVRPGGGR
jgi:hypothetical protein